MAANEQTTLGLGEQDFEFLNFQLRIFHEEDKVGTSWVDVRYLPFICTNSSYYIDF